jgi:FMN phosphatase YigB (HAD superfamily)
MALGLMYGNIDRSIIEEYFSSTISARGTDLDDIAKDIGEFCWRIIYQTAGGQAMLDSIRDTVLKLRKSISDVKVGFAVNDIDAFDEMLKNKYFYYGMDFVINSASTVCKMPDPDFFIELKKKTGEGRIILVGDFSDVPSGLIGLEKIHYDNRSTDEGLYDTIMNYVNG